MKLVVIFYPHIDEYGGIERNIIALIEKINAMDVTPVLVCFYDRIGMHQFSSYLRIEQLKDHWNPLVKGIRLKRWLKKNNKYTLGLPLFFGTKAGFYAALASINSFALHYTDPPSLLSQKTYDSNLKKILSKPRQCMSNVLIKRSVYKATHCITMTNWNNKELTNLYGRSFNVVYQGGVSAKSVPFDVIRCLNPVLRIFSICRLSPSKNINWILETAKFLKSNKPFSNWYQSIQVVIAGSGPEMDNLKTVSENLGISSIVKFPGFLSEDEVEYEYKNADLFLVPGKQGYGLPVLEALYRHVPVVLNKESRISEIFSDNPWISVTENSMESFVSSSAKYIEQIRKNPPLLSFIKNLPTEDIWASEIGKLCYWW